MKGRVLFTALLTLVFCLTAVFPVAAVQPSAKDLVLAAVRNMDMGMNEAFYEKFDGQGSLEVTRFDGSLSEMVGDFSGSKLTYSMELDDSQDAMKIGYDTDIKGIARDGEIYLHGDKVILSKDFFLLLQDFGVNVFENSDVSLDEVPEYLYLTDPQLEKTWEQMDAYQNGQLPEEYTELLLFVVEAIPDECFTLSPTKVTMTLDQDDLVDTVVNLLTKTKNESERVADFLISTNSYSFEQMGMDPAEMKQEIINDLADMTVPTREEIQAVISLIEVQDFSFEYSLLPGGPKTFNVDLGFMAPDGSMNGSFGLAVNAAGKKDNLQGSYSMVGKFSAVNGPDVNFDYESRFDYTDTVALGDSTLDLTVKDNTTGEMMLDLGVVSDSVSEINTGLSLVVPELTADNSQDLTELIPTSGVVVEQANQEVILEQDVVVNGVAIDGKSRIGKDGQIVVPARAVLEQLGYEVQWVEPNELRVNGDNLEISLFMDQKTYLVHGVRLTPTEVGSEERELYASPYLDGGSAVIPLGFLASEEIGAIIDLSDPLVITNF